MCSEECCERIWHKVVVPGDKNQRTIFRVNWKVLVWFTLYVWESVCVCVCSLARHSTWIIHYGDTRTMWLRHSNNHSLNFVIHLIQFCCPFVLRSTSLLPFAHYRSAFALSCHYTRSSVRRICNCCFLLWRHWTSRTFTLPLHILMPNSVYTGT